MNGVALPFGQWPYSTFDYGLRRNGFRLVRVPGALPLAVLFMAGGKTDLQSLRVLILGSVPQSVATPGCLGLRAPKVHQACG